MNFDFLKGLQGLGYIYENCTNAEKLAMTMPVQSVFTSRKSAEQLAKFIYIAAHNQVMDGLSFADILADRAVRDYVTRDVLNAFHYIRKNGNRAVHGNDDETPEEAVKVLEDLHFVAGETAYMLEYLYIPDSVTEIRDNFMGNTPFDGCDLLVVHCPAGSEAENYCIEHGMDYVIDDEPIKPIKTTGAIKSAAKSTIKSVNDDAVSAALMGTKISRYDYILGENGVLERYFPDEDDDRYIERIILPDGISAIGKEAFRSKTIVSVVIPEGVETIGESAFAFCDRLETVILPNSLRTIGIDAFSMDDNLTSIVVPEGVETIGENAFLGCNSLETVVLPSTLRETDAFVACDNIKDIYLPDSALSADNLDYLIGNLPNGAVIHTDRGCAVEMIAKEYDYFDFEVVYE